MTAPPDDNSADFHAVIAALRAERDAVLSEKAALAEALATRNSEFGERIKHQTTTIEVLKAMSASPDDAQPVFDLIARQAATLCNVPTAAVATFDGTMLHLATQSGFDAAYADAYVSQFPRPVGQDLAMGRAILNRRVEQVEDITAYPGHSFVGVLGHWSVMAVPMLRHDVPLGAITIGRPAIGPFSASQVALLQTFAEQAVIAITSAETYRALQTRTRDLQETLEYQTATSDVLNVISRSIFDLEPVFQTVASTAVRLCNADQAGIYLHQNGEYQWAGGYSQLPEYERIEREVKIRPGTGTLVGRVALEGRPVQVLDAWNDPLYEAKEDARVGAIHTLLGVPLLRDGSPIGVIGLGRQKIEPFTERQIELVSTFAAQAVIAMENARLLTEQREALEQQTATAEVLQVINASQGNLQPVFDAVLEKGLRLCGAAFGTLYTFDGKHFRAVAMRGLPAAYAEFRTKHPPEGRSGGGPARMLETKRPLHILDLKAEQYYHTDAERRKMVELTSARSCLGVPLLKDEAMIGFISIYRQEVRAFSDKEIALAENFAAHAVIAMENARLLDAIRQRQEELRVTFENMGDGVAMFNETQHLVAWNRKFQDMLDVPDEIIARRQTFSEYVRYLAKRGEYGPEAHSQEHVRGLIEQAGQSRTYERTRPDGRVIEIRHNPVARGGFVLIYADITERKRNEVDIRAARDAAENASRTIEAAYRELKAAQANLIQAEKMASLGQLTAGIAHEIKNPLNFVNNFSDLSVDLLNELQEAVAPGKLAVADSLRAEIDDITTTLKGNLEKIAEHGRRADSIVRNMLLHSRTGPSEHRAIDVNTTVEEALNLAYHGARAETPGFNITMEKDLDPKAGSIDAFPQEFLRVMLNLISNGFYAARKRANATEDRNFEPTLHLTTRNLGSMVEIRVRDNGTGIGEEVRDKIFEPFFTTKPAGEGTGLGLSLSYDIIVKQHGGQLTVDSRSNDFTEFQITLPRRMAANEGGRA
jgi:two-component system, NtrC family, sensor kinase